MSTIQVCRTCLAHDVRMYTIAGTPLQTFYENIAKISVSTEDVKPSVVCYLCYHLLKKCLTFTESAVKANEVLEQIYKSGIQITAQYISNLHKPFLFSSLKKSPVTNINAASELTNIEVREVKPEDEENTSDVDGDSEHGEIAVEETQSKRFEIEKETSLDVIGTEVEGKLSSDDARDDHSLDPEGDADLTAVKLEEDDVVGEEGSIPDKDKQGSRAVDATEVPEEISTVMQVEVKKETALETSSTKEDGRSSEDALQSPDHQSSDSDDNVPLDKVSLEEQNMEVKMEVSESGAENKETNAEFRVITLTRDEQIAQMLEKTKSPKYLRMRHKCALCCEGFPTLPAFAAHEKRHEESSGAFECAICRVRCRTARQLQAHSHTSHVRRLYACGECSHRAHSEAEARNHYKREHGAFEESYLDCLTYLFGASEAKKRKLQSTTRSSKRLAVRASAKRDVLEGISDVQASRRDETNKQPESVKKIDSKNRCNYCDYKCTKKSVMEIHIRTHTGAKPFTCNYCEKKFSGKRYLSRHLRIHTGEKPFSCKFCKKKFSVKVYLSQHLKIHTGERPFTCNYCDSKFSQKSYLSKHLRIHTGEKPFSCKFCKKQFSLKVYLSKHLRIHTGERPFTCNDCEKTFLSKCSLTRHLKIHMGKKSFSCNYCNKLFSDKSNLKGHLRIHTGERPFTCNDCEKKFSHKHYLTNHLKIHTGEKLFTCNYCEKKFSGKYNLSQHLKIHTGERPFTCNYCDKLFLSKCNLSRHLRIHTGEKPFSCNYCNKLFSDKSYLSVHLRIHTGEKPFKCDYCEKNFSFKCNLREHLKIHTRERLLK